MKHAASVAKHAPTGGGNAGAPNHQKQASTDATETDALRKGKNAQPSEVPLMKRPASPVVRLACFAGAHMATAAGSGQPGLWQLDVVSKVDMTVHNHL